MRAIFVRTPRPPRRAAGPEQLRIDEDALPHLELSVRLQDREPAHVPCRIDRLIELIPRASSGDDRWRRARAAADHTRALRGGLNPRRTENAPATEGVR